MHLRRHQHPAQPAVDGLAQPQIGVIEHRGSVQQHLEHQHRGRRRPEHRDGRELDQHRQQDLDRMKARAGGDVDVRVGVMHPVQAPQQRHRVEHDMLQIDGKVECDHRQHECPPVRHLDGVQQSPAAFGGQQGESDRCQRKQQAQDQAVQRHQREVVQPAHPPWQQPCPPRCNRLPDRHQDEHAEERAQADGRLVG